MVSVAKRYPIAPDRDKPRPRSRPSPAIDKNTLYRLPWTRDDNPNGWIEPTTYCQLKCPGCYRALDQDGVSRVHMPLSDAKKEVDDLIRNRRVATISLAGGEPLMYPQLDELVDYIRSRNVEVQLVTNGVQIDEAMLRHLKEKDVGRIVIHIDRHQGRTEAATEEAAIELRQQYCDLFRKVGGMSLGFIQPLSIGDMKDLPKLIRFFKENADVIELVTLIRLQPLDLSEQLLDGDTLAARVRDAYDLEYCAYLPKTHSNGYGWLFGQAVFAGREMLGSIDKDMVQFFQEYHRRKFGQQVYTFRGRVPLRIVAQALFNPSIRRIVRRYIGLGGKRGKLHHQLVLLIDTPKKLAHGEYDRCLGCPDAMYYKGQLVPSCALEFIKGGEDIRAT